ncbi:MAG: hypothetical protein M1546_26535 [Chloroflexi bacterium]|nr:hypothetical protein [Chloroflexota bacterium]
MFRKKLIQRGTGALLLALLALGPGVMPALAHGKSELTVSPAEITPGGTVMLRASGVEPGETFTISLEGPQFRTTLGTVNVTQETFEQGYTVPASVPADVYQVRAVSEEGETLGAELTVSTIAGTASQPESLEPTAELMQLTPYRAAGQIAVMMAAGVLSGLIGLWLARSRQRSG